jgi:hypothetical protein
MGMLIPIHTGDAWIIPIFTRSQTIEHQFRLT